jgi:hypothetical protein
MSDSVRFDCQAGYTVERYALDAAGAIDALVQAVTRQGYDMNLRNQRLLLDAQQMLTEMTGETREPRTGDMHNE